MYSLGYSLVASLQIVCRLFNDKICISKSFVISKTSLLQEKTMLLLGVPVSRCMLALVYNMVSNVIVSFHDRFPFETFH